ncbi:histidine phosphatase superfamily [Mycena olivaceomarginata]|nr:histidine phosphatase superfamily [Mycena olivaceomarginata]
MEKSATVWFAGMAFPGTRLDLGISTRLKYGFLLKNFTESNTIPVFRTESQDRMLASAMNVAIGFFGYPFEGQYQQSITIEADGFNNTLAPYKTCPNANDPLRADRGRAKVAQGTSCGGEDMYVLQQLCAYETIALGYSKFCELFTEEEWDGFDYSLDLYFWYNSAFGFALGRPLGIGYVQELVARLTHTPIVTHNSSTNGTLNDDPTTFPLGQGLYVDATHEVVVLQVVTVLGLSTLAAEGTLPADHIPQHRTFGSRELAPFVTNVHFQPQRGKMIACRHVSSPPFTITASCLARLQPECTPNTTKNTARARTPIPRRRAPHTTRPLLDRGPSLTNMLASGKPPAVQVASLTPTGIHLEDGLLILSACIFLDGTVFLWDPPTGVTAGAREHLRVFEAVVPRPEILLLGTGAEMAHPPPSVRAYLAGLGIQVEVMSTMRLFPPDVSMSAGCTRTKPGSSAKAIPGRNHADHRPIYLRPAGAKQTLMVYGALFSLGMASTVYGIGCLVTGYGKPSAKEA